MKYLLDSNIIIYHLNNESLATEFLIEVLSFPFTPEQEKDVKEFLESFKIIDVSREIAIQAIRNRKIKKIKVPDNIIVSTAQVNDLILVTRNSTDFNSLSVHVFDIFLTK